jgi:serine/threonine protein kinase
LPEQFILKILYDISKALAGMHQRDPPIAHRDVKVNNILLHTNKLMDLQNILSLYLKGLLTCKYIGTFCLVQMVITNYEILEVVQNKRHQTINEDDISAIQSDIYHNTTPLYRAPEQLDFYSNYQLNEKVDVW